MQAYVFLSLTMKKLSFASHWGINRNRVTRNALEEGNTGRFTGRLEDLDFADVLHYYQVQGSSSSRTIAYMANDDGLLFLGRRRAGAADKASWKSKFLAPISTRRSGTDDDGKYYIYWLVGWWKQAPGQGYCAASVGKTLNSHSLSLSTWVYKWVKANLDLWKGDKHPQLNQHSGWQLCFLM